MSEPAEPNVAAEEARLRDIRGIVEYKVSRLQPEKMNASQISTTKEKLAEEYGLGMTALLMKNPGLEDSSMVQYKASLDKFHKTVDDIEEKMCDKINVIENAYPRTFQPQTRVEFVGQSQARQFQLLVQATVAKAKIKYNTLLDLALTTAQDMEEEGMYIETASDERIQKLVQKISKYEIIRDKIKTSHSEYLEFTAVDHPDNITHDPKKLDKAVRSAISITDTLIVELENQDDERGLSTLLPRKSEKVKWPSFCGKPGESIFKFKEQFFKAARQNQTTRADQLSKLIENLQGFPLTLVPDTMKNVQDAFKRLSDMYGDPQKLVNSELKKLEALTMFPNCDDGSYTMGTIAQAKWLLQVETIMTELVRMGSDDDADRDLKRSVYGPQTTSTILSKFPPILKQKLLSAAKAYPAKEKLDIFKLKIKEWSEEALEMEKYLPEAEVVSKKTIQHVQNIIQVTGSKSDTVPTIQLLHVPKLILKHSILQRGN